MTDTDREAFEGWQNEPHRIGTYHSNLEAWQAARDRYAPKITEKEAVEVAAQSFDSQTDVYDPVAMMEAFRAAGVRFKEEA
jgi:hypothetical protein